MGLKQKQDYVNWLRKYDWTWLCTLTFREGIRRKATRRIFEEWVAQLQSSEPEILSWVRMGEHSSEKLRFHFHVLIAGVQRVTLREATARWERLAGRAEIGVYDPNRRGLEYSLKSIEDTADFDMDLHLENRHLHSNARQRKSSALPADSATAVTLRRREDDPAVPIIGAHAYSNNAQAEEWGNCKAKEEQGANGRPVSPAPQQRARRSSDVRVARLKTLDEIWRAMYQKCRSPKPPNYNLHGDTRLPMCFRWRGAYGLKLFKQDVGERPSPLHRLRRIDKKRGYGPDNCRWERATSTK